MKMDYNISVDQIVAQLYGDDHRGLAEYADTKAKEREREADAKRRADEIAASLQRKLPLMSLAQFPDYIPEKDNVNVLIKGRWLERGGSAFIISTAGTGKSIHSLQLALSMTVGLPFSGLVPLRPLSFWICQSEDSPTRVTIDREDITAELAEQHPEVNWREVWDKVKFLGISSKIGSKFLHELNEMLNISDELNQTPDVIILNPFMAFIGGPITDGSFVTPFLRGGEINRDPTIGLQAILEAHGVGLITYHHTPKPPTEKEIDAWLNSPFPEYQGAGSSDITNWGRSFLTMMRVKGYDDIMCFTAGKNGGGLGWMNIDGVKRHYLAYSLGVSIDGGARHGWRELERDELAEIVKDKIDTMKTDVDTIVSLLTAGPIAQGQIEDTVVKGMGRMTQRRFRAAFRSVMTDAAKYNLVSRTVPSRSGRGRRVTFWGTPEALANVSFAEDVGGESSDESAERWFDK